MCELKFNTRIYKSRAIKEAMSVYSQLGKFTLKYTNKYARVRIDDIKPEVKNILPDEFANYVLGVTKKYL